MTNSLPLPLTLVLLGIGCTSPVGMPETDLPPTDDPTYDGPTHDVPADGEPTYDDDGSGAPSDDEPLPDFDDEHVGASEEALSGSTQRYFVPVVRIRVAGTTSISTGVLVTNRLVLTTPRLLALDTRLADVTVDLPGPNGQLPGQSRRAAHMNFLPGRSAVVIQVRDPFSVDGSTTSFRTYLDMRAPTSLVGQSLTCYGFEPNGTLRRTHQTVRTGRSTSYDVVPGAWQDAIGTEDAGSPCFDLDDGALVGLAVSTASGVNTQIPAQNLVPWVSDMFHLEAARVATGSRSWVFYTDPQSMGTPGIRCADVAWASTSDHARVNQYPCHYGRNQRWYFRQVPGQAAGIVAIVSDQSGKCLDIPGGATAPNTRLQQYTCHYGPNQRFRLDRERVGHSIVPVAVDHLGHCVGVEGGPGNLSVSPLVHEPCGSGDPMDRRWGFIEQSPTTPL